MRKVCSGVTLCSIAILVVLPVLVQLPALIGWLSANPLFRDAGLNIGHVNQIVPGFPGWIDPNSGATTQALGHLAADDWLQGHLPWWNPYAGLGMPLAAEMQNSALFLPFVLLLHFTDGLLYLKISLQILIGLCMLAFLREIGVGQRERLAGALLLEFCGTFAWFGHAPITPIAFLPLLMLGIERCVRLSREGRSGGWPIIALAIAGSIVAGFPETAFMDGLLALFVAAWRLASAGSCRLDLARRIIGGGLVGLMLSAPAWLPFVESLPVSYLGQNTDLRGSHLMAASYGLLLLPYLLGPLLYGPETIHASPEIWWHTGGYCDIAMVFIALVAITGKNGRQMVLRRVLAAWLALSLLKAAGAPVISQAFDLIPFIRQTLFYVYAAPGWEFALCVLAALALDDLKSNAGPSRRRIGMLAALCVVAAVVAFRMALPLVREMASHLHDYPLYPILSAAWAIIAVAGLGFLLAPGRGPFGRRAASSLLVVNGIALFAIPLLSGTVAGNADTALMKFLQDRAGFERFYSMFIVAPNYGSYFRVASLNYTAVPVPLTLTRRLARDLDPDMDMSGMLSDRLHNIGRDAVDPAAEQITAATAIARLERLGVGYLVMPRGFDPLVETIAVQAAHGSPMPQSLAAGTSITGSLSTDLTGNADIRQVGILVGTYGGHPQGVLTLTICAGANCSTGQGDLSGAVDNQPFWIVLAQPLRTGSGDRIDYRIDYRIPSGQPTSPLAIWTVPLQAKDQTPSSGIPNGRAAFMLLRHRTRGAELELVYRDALADIVHLPDPAPYLATEQGHCALQLQSRQELTATCSGTDRLIRRELFFPGWSATVSGHPVAIDIFDDSFQSIPLASGRSRVRFDYAPPYIGWAWTAMLFGVAILGLSQDLRRRT